MTFHVQSKLHGEKTESTFVRNCIELSKNFDIFQQKKRFIKWMKTAICFAMTSRRLRGGFAAASRSKGKILH